MKICTKVLALALSCASATHIQPLTETEVTCYAALGGVASGALLGGIAYAEFSHRGDKVGAIVGLATGGIIGGLMTSLLYNLLSLQSPKERLSAARNIIKTTSQTLLAKDDYTNDSELFDIANKYFDHHWPIAHAYEACVNMSQNLRHAENILKLAAQDTKEFKLLGEIKKLSSAIAPLIETLEKHAEIFQTHIQYDVQARQLAACRKVQQLEEDAEQLTKELNKLRKR